MISHPQPRPSRALHPRRAAGRGHARGREHRRGGPEVSESDEPWAALGRGRRREIYDCVVLRAGVEDSAENVTRFIWLAPAAPRRAGDGPWKTSLSFSELGADHPGALVDALTEFSSRDVNLTRIESRPLRRGFGRYMFFCDLDGAAGDQDVAEAIAALRGKAENVRVLGSYPLGVRGIPDVRLPAETGAGLQSPHDGGPRRTPR